jgi:hypothetical protein
MTTTANTRGRPRDAHGLPQVHRADMSLDRSTGTDPCQQGELG